MPTPGVGTIGSLDFTPEERRQLAIKSKSFECSECGKITQELATGVSKPLTEEEKTLIDCVAFKEEDGQETSGGAEPESLTESVEMSQSGIRQRVLSSPNSMSAVANSGLSGASNLLHTSGNSVNVHSPPNSGASNMIERHRSFIITLIVLTIGLLVLRRLILS